ncbi:uncharacterized protein LOC112093117 [Morus notabilis]|uniref:uncharacterized protein LOC112093117 n=1 Tax=Morus notabilis TaxID=981085 RepID=UPI000CED26DF|nr:uncharacterized protein LOC112093117 [Morus notabilis]
MHDVEGMTWKQFEALFNEQFFPQSYRDEKAMEFMGLQQGDMTVREYEARFNELSCFAPSLIESERTKCLKFKKGLKGVIQKSVVALRHRVYSDLVAAAISVEQEHITFLQDREALGRTSGGPQRSNRKSRDQGHGSGGVPSGSSGSSGSRKSGPYSFKCHHYGELGHIKRNCPSRGQQVNQQTRQLPQNQRGIAPSQDRLPQFTPFYQPQLPAQMPIPPAPIFRPLNYSYFRPQASVSVQSTPPQQQYKPGNQRPNNNERGKGKAPGQMHTMAGESSGAHAGNPVVEGLKPDDLETSMFISFPLRRVEVTIVCRSCVITIGSEKLKADLIILPMNQFDVVLGMDWLSRYGVIVDCHRMRVTLTTDSEGESGVTGENVEVPVVDEYADVFPDELPGLPPDREIEFYIDLLPETASISIAPY